MGQAFRVLRSSSSAAPPIHPHGFRNSWFPILAGEEIEFIEYIRSYPRGAILGIYFIHGLIDSIRWLRAPFGGLA
jgi:hypothetical protein